MKIREIEFYDFIDNDDKMAIDIDEFDNFTCQWINKDEAELIINHLKNKFEIDM